MKLPKIEFNAPVVILYTLASFVVLMFGYATGNASTDEFFTCYRTSVSDPMMWVRMVTYVFGHADINHYVSNFSLIALAGPMLEEKYGSRRLALMMFITAFVGGAANVLLKAEGVRGASGIAFLFIVLCSCTSAKSGKIPLTMILVVAIYIGQEVLAGMTMTDNVSHMTHILGGVCGIVFGLYYIQKGVEPKKVKSS
ncbi:MAG: rhomboid family intramembrane serine protease [Oscillospiraceae bacterium]|nr:rhomboid family intramembrane serine protease [Oscillospiraceae bacterium]